MEAAFLPGKKPNTHRMGDGMESSSRSGGFREKKVLSLPGFEPWIIQTVGQSQSRLHYTGILLLLYA
jgi:hypothetical protein